jgi:hypothetical protein
MLPSGQAIMGSSWVSTWIEGGYKTVAALSSSIGLEKGRETNVSCTY